MPVLVDGACDSHFDVCCCQRGTHGESIARISVALPQIRTDRRKVRVVSRRQHPSPAWVPTALATRGLTDSAQHLGCCVNASKSDDICYQDRVEAGPEQLASAMATAEKLSEGGRPKVRVIGWYHRYVHPYCQCMPVSTTVQCIGL